METVWMTKEYQMISDCKNQREGMTTLTTLNRQLMTKRSVWDDHNKATQS